ncbi:MAG: rod shape-determining protein RodA [Desulfovibrionaceae bacterium]|nr:rod shape-determining protein RodA [Desulfovibrionaceae bacterium]
MSLIDRRLFTHMNWALLGCVLLLFLAGVLNLYSASGMRLEDGISVSSFYQRQMIWGLLGLAAMLLTITFDYRQLRNLAWPLLFVTLILLAAVPVIGVTVNGAKRWLPLGVLNFQPAELAKLTVLILGARLLSRDGRPLGWGEFLRILLVGVIPAAFILMQPDLGTTLNLLLLLGGMILFHGLKPGVLKSCFVALPCMLPLLWFGMRDYQRQRILTFLDPSSDPRGAGYHIIQSQIAIGSGQTWGKGFLGGTQSQLRFLPEKHSDFAMAVYGEEWGFVGCMALLILFSLFLLTIFNTVVEAKDRFGSMLAAGVFLYFFWQILINMGMVIGLMPVVGIPLPFISYGGSATLINFALVGIVLNVSMRRFMFKG